MFQIPSPITQLHFPLFEKSELKLFLKRDDLIHPIISGNKWRKLKYVLEDAEKKGQKHLVSFGGAYSNHLLALACAGAAYRFRTTAFVRGEKPEKSNPTLFLCSLFGMELLYVSRESYKNKQQLFSDRFGNMRECRFIDEGGTSLHAVQGCAEMIAELPEEYDSIFCAAGTGTTMAGIAKGASVSGSKCVIEGIAVLKDASFLEAEVEKIAPGLRNWKLHTDFHEGGYAKCSADLLAFIRDFARNTGILLDQVYTGKMLKGLFTLAEQDYFKSGSRILAVHTGGWTGLLSQQEQMML